MKSSCCHSHHHEEEEHHHSACASGSTQAHVTSHECCHRCPHCQCDPCRCHAPTGSDKCNEFASKLLELADEAWMDVLREKIEQHVHELSGRHLDELAKIVAEANHHKWKHKMKGEKCCREFRQQVANFFHHKSQENR